MTERLNVMHITSNLAGGGVQRLLVKSLAVLDRADMTHQVCCVSGGGVYEDELRALDIPYWIMKRRARFDPTVILQIARLLRRQRIDVVHTLNFTANTWGRTAARLSGVRRIIAHERGTAWTESATMRLVDRVLYRWTDVLLANSEAAKSVLVEHVGVPADRIQVVYNGMPRPSARADGPTLREHLGIGTAVPLVVTVGRLDTPKGLFFLLRAMPEVWKAVPEAHFAIIGGGPLRDCLEAEASQLPGAASVHLTGFLANVPDLIGEADLMVHPAIRESLGNVLIEAGWARLPAVASNVDGCAEVIVDGETGLLIDCTLPVEHVDVPGTSPLPEVVVDGHTRALRPPLGPAPEQLAQAIVGLLQDPQLRQGMGARAQERVQRMFSLERYVRDLETVYRAGPRVA